MDSGAACPCAAQVTAKPRDRDTEVHFLASAETFGVVEYHLTSGATAARAFLFVVFVGVSVGMPRPLSITLIELSVWIVTVISLQKPANASSMALSTTSNTMWCRPVPSEVSPMYIPGRLRTASKPFSTLMLSES